MKKIYYMVVLSVLMLTGCNSTKVTQIKKDIELGENYKIEDCLNYDESIHVELAEGALIDSSTCGEYEVTFDITDKNNKTTQTSFVFNVVDTTAPTIEVEDEITVIAGTDFNVVEYVITNDASNNVELTISPRPDTTVTGTSDYTITGKDASDNEVSKQISITIMDRDVTNFRSAVWGDSEELIKNLERATLLGEEGSMLLYSDKVATYETNVLYSIDDTYGLYAGTYQFDVNYISGNLYINDYYAIKDKMEQVYGSPSVHYEPKIIDSLYNYTRDDGQALIIGYIAFYSSWEIPEQNTEIILTLFNDRAQKIVLLSTYRDTRFEEENLDGL